MIFEGLSLKQLKKGFLEGENPTLNIILEKLFREKLFREKLSF